MRKRLIIMMALTATAWAWPSGSASGQCGEQLIAMSAELMDDYTYIKDIKVRMKKTKKNRTPMSHKYVVILQRGMKYRFISTSAEEYPGKLVFKIFNRSNVLVMSNYSQSTGKIYDVVDYTCKAAGQYYVEVSFTDGQEGCAACVIGFRRKKTEYEVYLDN